MLDQPREIEASLLAVIKTEFERCHQHLCALSSARVLLDVVTDVLLGGRHFPLFNSGKPFDESVVVASVFDPGRIALINGLNLPKPELRFILLLFAQWSGLPLRSN